MSVVMDERLGENLKERYAPEFLQLQKRIEGLIE
jgi:hypothetical protein